ncbi:MAG: HAD-IA family hydrolase [Crocinitomicaceae bacterium]
MPYPIDQLDALLWDFDGVILNSMEVRDIGFEKIFEDYPDEMVEELLDFHRYNGGLSRYVKIEHFYKNISKEDYNQEDIQRKAEGFSEIMRAELPQKKYLIEDALTFIREYYNAIPFHIVSGSDQNELRFLCKELDITQYFISIHGSPTPKKQLVKTLLEENNYNREKTAIIGDSINDFEAAEHNKIAFFGYNNEELRGKGKYIEQLSSCL